jgi:hypothetical protein
MMYLDLWNSDKSLFKPLVFRMMKRLIPACGTYSPGMGERESLPFDLEGTENGSRAQPRAC